MAEITVARRLKSERGAELIEFALVLPLLLLVVLGIAEFGFVFMRFEAVNNAAREGARLAVLPGYANIDVQNRVVAYANVSGAPGMTTANVAVANTTVTVAAGVTVNCKRVTVTYTYTYQFLNGIAGLFGTSYTTIPMTGVSEMRTEGAL